MKSISGSADLALYSLKKRSKILLKKNTQKKGFKKNVIVFLQEKSSDQSLLGFVMGEEIRGQTIQSHGTTPHADTHTHTLTGQI